MKLNAVSVRRSAGVLGVAAALAISGATLAQASARGARRISHRLTATVQEVDIRTGPVPSAGSTATAAATIESTPGGNGAQVTHLRFTGPTAAPATFGFTGHATAFFARGSVRFVLNGTLALEPGGKLKFEGTGKITGGTGAYNRATGRMRFAGAAPSAAAGHVDTLHYKGTISY
jgi:hypothetical protein